VRYSWYACTASRHPLLPRRLTVRISFNETKRVSEHLVGAPESQQRVEAGARRRQAQLFQTGGFSLGEVRVSELGIRRAIPEVEGLVEDFERLGDRKMARPVHECLEPPGVHVVHRQSQRVAGRPVHDCAGSQRGAQTRDVGLKCVQRTGRRGARPNDVDETSARHHGGPAHDQRRQQPTLPGRRQRRAVHAQSAQDLTLDHG
jgi:hypothetical protein